MERKNDRDINFSWCAWNERTHKGFKKMEEVEISGRIETIQVTGLLRLARIARRVLESREKLLSLRLQWKPPLQSLENTKRFIQINYHFLQSYFLTILSDIIDSSITSVLPYI